MRTIKFRIWSKEGKSMSQLTAPILNGEIILDVEEKNEWVFMQWTGLKDKNGKEIFEGDLVSSGSIIYEVIFLGRVYDFRDVNALSNQSHPAEMNQPVEVIGNIFQNPELLKI